MALTRAIIWPRLSYLCRVVCKAFIFYTNVIFTLLFIIDAFIKMRFALRVFWLMVLGLNLSKVLDLWFMDSGVGSGLQISLLVLVDVQQEVYGSWFWFLVLWCTVDGLGLIVYGFGLRVLRCRVWDLGCRVSDVGYRL